MSIAKYQLCWQKRNEIPSNPIYRIIHTVEKHFSSHLNFTKLNVFSTKDIKGKVEDLVEKLDNVTLTKKHAYIYYTYKYRK